jgi:citrate lyase subunit beta / citryl-CoA lyase
MRSLLFVPAHDARKLMKGLDCGADALIIDLAGPGMRRENRGSLPLFVHLNASATGLMLDDLAAVECAQPYGILLSKCGGGREVAHRCVPVGARGATGRPSACCGSCRSAPNSPLPLFEMPSHAYEAGTRLCGMKWGGEDLATDIGASANRIDGLCTRGSNSRAASACLALPLLIDKTVLWRACWRS